MPLSRFETMDSVMLLSIVNMQLRDKFDNLADLAAFYEIDAQALSAKLAVIDYYYHPDTNQFK